MYFVAVGIVIIFHIRQGYLAGFHVTAQLPAKQLCGIWVNLYHESFKTFDIYQNENETKQNNVHILWDIVFTL